MKKLVLLGIFVVTFSSSLYSQIIEKTIPTEDKQEKRYDSVYSLNANNMSKHIGQTLYALSNGYNESVGFGGLLNLGNGIFFNSPYLGKDDSTKYYKAKKYSVKNELYSATNYAEVANKYFNVVDIIKKGKYDPIYLKLIRKDNGDTLYLRTNDECRNCDLFITLGYYDRLKNKHQDKKYYTTSSFSYGKADTIKKITIPQLTPFVCSNVEISSGDVYAVMHNDTYGNVKGEFKKNGFEIKDFIDRGSYDFYLKRFGKIKGRKILKGEIEIGMTTEMVEIAYGKPQKIDRVHSKNGDSEQWVYGDMRLYFIKGVLKTIHY